MIAGEIGGSVCPVLPIASGCRPNGLIYPVDRLQMAASPTVGMSLPGSGVGVVGQYGASLDGSGRR